MNTFKKYGFLALLGITGLAFLAAGIAKLMGVAAVHQSFAILGLPVAFGYFIGACEVAGAVGLFIKKLSALAASGLGLIMVGAMYYHIQYDPAHLVPAALLFVFCMLILFVRKQSN